MMYQYDEDYLFSSEKYEIAFGENPTSYEAGIRETVAAQRN
jgi:YHS domain-containing protein